VDDDYVNSLLFEIKQEIIDNFFAERRRLEEERAVCDEIAAEQRLRLRGLTAAKARLKALLLDEVGLQRFCTLTGAGHDFFPPEAPAPPIDAAPLRPRGLTMASRYGAALAQAYEDVARRAEEYVEGQADLNASLGVYNEDAEAYRRNYDVMTIVAVLNRMAPEEMERRHWLGENFRPEETASLADSLTVRQMRMPADLAAAAALPALKETRARLREVARELCRRRPEEARAMLERCLSGAAICAPER